MAFDKNYTNADSGMCPICRRQYTEGRRLLHKGYPSEGMCRDCFERVYKNPSGKRTAGYSDDSTNPLTRLRPAPILEKPLLLKGKYPAGYEYSMPNVTGLQLLLKLAVWLCVAGALQLMMLIAENTGLLSEAILCSLAGKGIIVAGSAILALHSVILFIKGLFLGMGIPRRIILLAEIVIFTSMAVKSFPIFMLFFS